MSLPITDCKYDGGGREQISLVEAVSLFRHIRLYRPSRFSLTFFCVLFFGRNFSADLSDLNTVNENVIVSAHTVCDILRFGN